MKGGMLINPLLCISSQIISFFIPYTVKSLMEKINGLLVFFTWPHLDHLPDRRPTFLSYPHITMVTQWLLMIPLTISCAGRLICYCRLTLNKISAVIISLQCLNDCWHLATVHPQYDERPQKLLQQCFIIWCDIVINILMLLRCNKIIFKGDFCCSWAEPGGWFPPVSCLCATQLVLASC